MAKLITKAGVFFMDAMLRHAGYLNKLGFQRMGASLFTGKHHPENPAPTFYDNGIVTG